MKYRFLLFTIFTQSNNSTMWDYIRLQTQYTFRLLTWIDIVINITASKNQFLSEYRTLHMSSDILTELQIQWVFVLNSWLHNQTIIQTLFTSKLNYQINSLTRGRWDINIWVKISLLSSNNRTDMTVHFNAI